MDDKVRLQYESAKSFFPDQLHSASVAHLGCQRARRLGETFTSRVPPAAFESEGMFSSEDNKVLIPEKNSPSIVLTGYRIFTMSPDDAELMLVELYLSLLAQKDGWMKVIHQVKTIPSEGSKRPVKKPQPGWSGISVLQ